MRVDDFDFELPEDRIALRPVEPRDSARMLVVDPAAGRLEDCRVRDLPGFLRRGDALVFNDTRVIPARLFGARQRGDVTAKIEILLHRRVAADRWWGFARPAKKLAPGDTIRFAAATEAEAPAPPLGATLLERGESGEVLLLFDLAGPALDAAIAAVGALPLPPYIAAKRPVDARDAVDYQTILARKDGAIAAPTAALHVTSELLETVQKAGVAVETLTLHVGAGTFLPVKAEDTASHRMHAEWGAIDAETATRLNAVRARGGRIIAVGTTSLRLLESAADPLGFIHPFSGETDIFITPGYRFRSVDALMTNFHLPRSTLFMLVSAFSGLETMRRAYRHAIASGYRFYSYGDSSLLFPDNRKDVA